MMSLNEIATSVNGEAKGTNIRVTGVSSDTRTIQPGDLFVALKGPNFDGQDYVRDAQRGGAAAAMVQQESEADLPQVVVKDTLHALGVLAKTWRSRFSVPLIAVTGSNGKTTVKEMIGAILSTRAPCLVSPGNLNNDIGLPLALCSIRPHHQYAVVEMGMNRQGEIRYLTGLASPNTAVITNAAKAHLQGLGSIERVADAKAEILLGLNGSGVAVLNRDDAFFDYWESRAGSNSVLSFGFHENAEVHATEYENDSRFVLTIGGQSVPIQLSLFGRHNVSNALAAAAAAYSVGLNLDQIQAGLRDLKSVPGRLQLKHGLHGITIMDDSYNANPASVTAGIDVLSARGGKRILVLGEMAELGAEAETLHHDVGAHAGRMGLDGLYCVGDLTRHAVSGFGKNARHFSDKNELIDQLLGTVDADTTVLIKGSRSMRMEDVVAALSAGDNGAAEAC